MLRAGELGFRRCLPVGIQLPVWEQLTLSCWENEEAGKRAGSGPTPEAALCIRMRGEGGDYPQTSACLPLLASTGLSPRPPPPPHSPQPPNAPFPGGLASGGNRAHWAPEFHVRLLPDNHPSTPRTNNGGAGVTPQSPHRQKACGRKDSNSSPLLRPLSLLLQLVASPGETEGQRQQRTG